MELQCQTINWDVQFLSVTYLLGSIFVHAVRSLQPKFDFQCREESKFYTEKTQGIIERAKIGTKYFSVFHVSTNKY